MKVVLVTTRAAKDLIYDVIKDIKGFDIKVLVLRNIPVAALATTNDIAMELRDRINELKNVDLVIIPGLVKGSAEVIEEVIGVDVVKGTIYAGDIPVMLEFIKRGLRLSKEKAADEVIGEYLRRSYEARFKEIMSKLRPLFKVKNVVFTEKPPPINLFLEVMVNKVGNASIAETIVKRLISNNYQGLILGCDIEECNVNKLIDVITWITKYAEQYDSPLLIGIDAPISLIAKLKDNVLSLIDMILNISPKSLRDNFVKVNLNDKVLVVPIEAELKFDEIKELINFINDLGLDKVIYDVPLRPPLLGLGKALNAYALLRSLTNKPLFIGLANVYELMDVDSHGIIALLESIAFEYGISNMLLTEESPKAMGALEEANIVRDLIYRAYLRRSPPIDVGLNLLIIKDKRRELIKPPKINDYRKVALINTFVPPVLDKNYYLKIYVDHSSKEIIVDVHDAKSGEIIKRFQGKDSLSLGRSIVRSIGLGNEHSLYLGYELCKAEIALALGKSYIQDVPLFRPHHFRR